MFQSIFVSDELEFKSKLYITLYICRILMCFSSRDAVLQIYFIPLEFTNSTFTKEFHYSPKGANSATQGTYNEGANFIAQDPLYMYSTL